MASKEVSGVDEQSENVDEQSENVDLSDVIKNPDRQKKIVEPYTPEYQRLGKDPIIDQYDPEIFTKQKKKHESFDVPKQAHANVGQNSNWFEPSSPATSKQKRVVGSKQNGVAASSNIDEGQYCILISNKIVATSDSKIEIENIIESILFDEGKEFENVTISDIMLIKRVPIKVGVVISDD